jgi:hypothetical protein
MRKAIFDLKKKCRSLKNQVKNVGGKKVYKMLHSINEYEEKKEGTIMSQPEELDESEEEEDCGDSSSIIGHADKKEIVKVF